LGNTSLGGGGSRALQCPHFQRVRIRLRELRDRKLRKTGVGDNALCLVIAIVLEAIQQNFQHYEAVTAGPAS
jgi:hypothetical protein